MRFTVEIELGNDAMQTWGDVRRVLRELVRHLSDATQPHSKPQIDGGKIMDVNGNSVGKWEVV